MRLARRFLISGRVQGVGFRFFVQSAAAREGLHGWVGNRPDGTVEIHAEGDRGALERFSRAVSQGPPGARVEGVETSDEDPAGREAGFVIR